MIRDIKNNMEKGYQKCLWCQKTVEKEECFAEHKATPDSQYWCYCGQNVSEFFVPHSSVMCRTVQ